MAGNRGGRVVVVGASMAGLLAARAVSEHAESVMLLERERLSETVAPRGHVPQGRHLHLLLMAGLDALAGWFPGIEAELESQGAVWVDPRRAWVHQGGAYRARGSWGRPVLSMTRPLLEHVVRRRVADLPGVTIADEAKVERVVVDAGRVTGVWTHDVEHPADLVVDCSGRNSRIAHDLAASGLLDPPITRVGIDIGYASFQMRHRPEDFEGDFLVCIDSPGSFRGGAILPIEGDRWQVTIAGVHGDAPPADDAGLLDFARTLPSPAVAQLLERCERVSDIETYRFPSSQRRHHEKVRDLPAGFVALGDAAASFNPIYGQGMTSSALQAKALEAAVTDLGVGSPGLPARFHRHSARVIDGPWRIAVGGDFAHPATVGPRPVGAPQLNGYLGRMVRAAHTSVPVARAINRVLQLSDKPTALIRPATVIRVLVHSRRSPVVTGAAVRHPRVGDDRVEEGFEATALG